MKEEKYYFVLIYGNNLLHFQEVSLYHKFRSFLNRVNNNSSESSLISKLFPDKWNALLSCLVTAGMALMFKLNWTLLSRNLQFNNNKNKLKSMSKIYRSKNFPKTLSRRPWVLKSKTHRTTNCQTQKTKNHQKKKKSPNSEWLKKEVDVEAARIMTIDLYRLLLSIIFIQNYLTYVLAYIQ